MARDDQPDEDALPRDLEQALRGGRAELESGVAGKLDLEARLAAIVGHKPAPVPPSANPAPAMSFEDFVVSRRGALYGFAYTLTGNRADAEDLVQVALSTIMESWDKRAGSMEPAVMDRYVRTVMMRRALTMRRRRPEGPLWGDAGHDRWPAIDDADAESILRAIDQMPGDMRAALMRLIANRAMTVGEAERVLRPDPGAMRDYLKLGAVRDYLKLARKARLEVEIRFESDFKGSK
jgi:hypothetical protein